MRLRAAVVAALVVSGACGGDGTPPRVQFPPEAARIYVEVVRHVHGLDGPDSERIFVRSTAGGERGDDAAITIPLDVQAQVAERLRQEELPPVEFVDHPEELLADEDDETGELRDHGMLVRLGLIQGTANQVRVRLDVYVDRDRQAVATLLLERGDDGWTVVERRDEDAAG